MGYVILSYLFLLHMENKVTGIQNILFEYSDKRFGMFESLLNKSLAYLEYDQTFIKEVVKLRSQAKKFKQDGDLRSAFFCEEKISQLALKISILFEEFPILNRIEDSDIIQNDIVDMENNMLEMKRKYNEAVVEYNKLKSFPLLMPVSNFFNRFSDEIELWRITT